MLVLSRKKDETIIINGNIEVVVLGIEGETIKLGIRAPRHVEVYRKELYDSIQQTNREAAATPVTLQELSAFIRQDEEN